ncbi:MAG: anthranilate synthase component II [Bradymonadia bacterium]
MSRVLLIDNYDSFTYNLVQAFLGLGAEVDVHRNDALTVAEAMALDFTHLVISPGPGRPDDAGISMALIEAAMERCPILGVCLGHQSITQVMGGTVGSARTLMHGKASSVYHDGQTLFQDLPSPMACGRYHSLAAMEADLPADLKISAYTTDGEIMGLRHTSLPVEGVQFHPESVLTPDGDRLLGNFLAQGSAS